MPIIKPSLGVSKTNWLDYWRNYLRNKYGKTEVSSEEDLFFQVARTVNRKPIDRGTFRMIIEDIKMGLDLQPNDVLVDLCCGNGLFTYELKDKVSRIIAVDFADEIVDTARRLKPSYNIDYCLEDVQEFLKKFATRFPGVTPGKYLMNDSIAYFSPEEVKNMLILMKSISHEGFIASFRGAPNDELKWNYYTTEEWKKSYLKSVEIGDNTHDGLGRWWQMADLQSICKELGLIGDFRNQPEYISNYRTDILVRFAP